ncbi:MAG TPA: PA2169 family four-helix-bundle protein [Cyclobacteriaceae bacterium]|nr:PA2169 family four-helix-bundle protein [Cyclobacteriaceae bacterium]
MEHEGLIDTLNELIAINKDRIEGYKKATRELSGEDVIRKGTLKTIEERINESQVFINELSGAVLRLGGKPHHHTTPRGKLYRMWMDLKTTITGPTTKTILELCEYGEDAILKTYQQVLTRQNGWPQEISHMLTRQEQILNQARETIKKCVNEMTSLKDSK